MSLLKVSAIGNLGHDPEMRYLSSGSPVCNFSIACNRKWTDADGTVHEETVWLRISAFGKLAENCNQYLAKGRQVYVEGRLRADANGGPRVYQKKDGSYGASYEIVAQTVQFLGGRGESSASAAPDAPEAEAAGEEEPIPF